MKLYHVVAMAKNRVIGKDNKLPWHFSADLKHFKQLTTGSTVIMGRKTFESIGKPLPNRENIILSRSGFKAPEGVKVFKELKDALKNIQSEKVFIIGGAEIFEQTMAQIDGIYLTQIDSEYSGDVFYPEIPVSFKEKSRTLLQEDPKIEVVFYQNSEGR